MCCIKITSSFLTLTLKRTAQLCAQYGCRGFAAVFAAAVFKGTVIMKKYLFFCIVFCFALTAYPQERTQADRIETVQSNTVSSEITIEPEAESEITAAQEGKAQDSMAEIKISELIQQGLFKNKTLISQQALLLTEEQRINIQEQHRLGYVKPLLFNSLLGFGIGNFVNKDRAGGITHGIIDSLAAGTIFVAGCVYLGNALPIILSLPLLPILLSSQDSYLLSSAIKTIEICKIIVQTGLGVLLANRVASIISVSVHTAKYNKTLKEALNPVRPDVSVQAVPIIAPNRLGLAVNINY